MIFMALKYSGDRHLPGGHRPQREESEMVLPPVGGREHRLARHRRPQPPVFTGLAEYFQTVIIIVFS